MNPALDSLLDTHFRTILEPERIAVLGQIVRHLAEQLPVMTIYYGVRSDAYANRLVNVSPQWSSSVGAYPSWDAQEWDVAN